MSKNTIKVSTGIQTYTFTDEDDHVFSSLRLNPTDVNLAARALEVSNWFDHIGELKAETAEEITKLNKDIEEKISYVLGYDASEVFGEVTATTIFTDGTVFAYLILDKIISEIGPAIEKRKERMEKVSEKYLEKYK